MHTTDHVNHFLNFVKKAPTAFQAIDQISDILTTNGFQQLEENDPWKLVPEKSYYVVRNGSSLIAFHIPRGPLSHFQIIASHSDSPSFKLKANYLSTAAGCYTRLNTEGYGGMIMSTWFDRPLSVAGRVLIRETEQIVSIPVQMKRDLVLIPSMPIHFNRDVNNRYAFNPQIDLLPLYGNTGNSRSLLDLIAEEYGFSSSTVLSFDLFLYSRTPGSIWGSESQFFSCGRIDDLECTYTSLHAFLSCHSDQSFVPVFAVFDNEEVGSSTKQGADSTFLSDTMERIAFTAGKNLPEIRSMISSSFLVSADNAHAVHPNHPEKYDEQNRVFMNKGIVIKSNARQKYATDAVSTALFTEICARCKVPVQYFSNRSDIPGGSTLGSISNTQTSMNTIDIGLAQLAMHSAYETAGCHDLIHMINGLSQFYQTDIRMISHNTFRLIYDTKPVCSRE